MRILLLLLLVLMFTAVLAAQEKPKGILLEDLTWLEAEKVLKDNTVVVIPLGAAAKEHGPHLKLKNDWLIAEYLKKQVLRQSNVVIAPTVNYNFYPAFLEYPGSTSLRLETARDLICPCSRKIQIAGQRGTVAAGALHPDRVSAPYLPSQSANAR